MKELLTTNKKAKYFGDSRYEKVWEQMQLLDIKDVSTERQGKNGTIVWKLPIKNWNSGKTNIEVASFSTGYVRNQNSGYSNYQLNKRCEGEPEYFDSGKTTPGGNTLYTKFSTRSCVLIPLEIDRLEYMMKYCIKNYFIKNANQVVNGDFVPKWEHESELAQLQDRYDRLADAARLDYEERDSYGELKLKIRDLENKLERIKTFLKHEII